MPPKRKAADRTSRDKPAETASDLAREHGLSAAQEAEIREAFSLFCVADPHSRSKARSSELDQVLKREDVRRCLISLGIRPSASDIPEILSTLDPTDTGHVRYSSFLSLAAIYLDQKDDADPDASAASNAASDLSSAPEDLSDDDAYSAPRSTTKAKARPKTKAPAEPKTKGRGKRKASAMLVEPTAEEIEAAYKLFTKGGTGPITIGHLRRVAKELKEDVSEQVLRDMILEANGEMEGPGDAWKQGVDMGNFKGVMTRAGVFG